MPLFGATGSIASDTTAKHLRALFCVVLCATLLFRAWFASVLPVTGDEAYFYLWGKHPAWGYYDHPPMVGWWLAALLTVSDHLAWLRLPSVVLPAVMAAVLVRFARPWGPQVAYGLGVLVLAAPVNVWNVLITTDTPLIYFSFFSALCFLVATRDDSTPWYVAAGVLLGGAFLSKYFAVLLGLAYAVFLLASPCRGRWPALGCVVAGAAPAVALNLGWNMGACWVNILFNFINRNHDGGLSWKTPLLYVATLVYLFTPLLAWRLLAARRQVFVFSSEPLSRALMCMVGVPLAVFALLSVAKTIGMHWLLAFVPLGLLFAVLRLPAERLPGLMKFFVGFAVLHAVLVVVIANLPVETWRKTRLYDGIVMTVKTDELLRELAPFAADYVFMTEGYSPSATLAYNARREVGVFGTGSGYAREDDRLTDFRALDGRNILVFSKGELVSSRFAPFFREVEVRDFTVRGAQYHLLLGRGFKYAAYRQLVLEEVRRRWYAIPAWLPQTGCFFCERYFQPENRS